MAYCVASDIQIELGIEDAFSASTIPTSTQVTSIISQVDGTINVYLKRAGITASSISDADQLLFLKDLSIKGGACRVGKTYFGNNAGIEGTQPLSYCEEFNTIINDTELLAEIFGPETDTGGIFENEVTNGTVAESDISIIDNEYIY